jgi:hypothetical protein
MRPLLSGRCAYAQGERVLLLLVRSAFGAFVFPLTPTPKGQSMKRKFVATARDHPLMQLPPPAPKPKAKSRLVKPKSRTRPVKKGK